jgi:hypothetical protein
MYELFVIELGDELLHVETVVDGVAPAGWADNGTASIPVARIPTASIAPDPPQKRRVHRVRMSGTAVTGFIRPGSIWSVRS